MKHLAISVGQTTMKIMLYTVEASKAVAVWTRVAAPKVGRR
jgi:hypothetical protein